MERDATISPCSKYRYDLIRIWDRAIPPVVFCMLNPSTADANIDDPTIRRCIGFGRLWNAGGVAVVNLYAYRATNPRDLLTEAVDPTGPYNDGFIIRWAEQAGRVVCAWGAYKPAASCARGERISRPCRVRVALCICSGKAGIKLEALHVNGDGSPKHPLYVSDKIQVGTDPASGNPILSPRCPIPFNG
jgi:hypothetical protein